jgi:diguanylate cyclase (GGDEF)-like protein
LSGAGFYSIFTEASGRDRGLPTVPPQRPGQPCSAGETGIDTIAAQLGTSRILVIEPDVALALRLVAAACRASEADAAVQRHESGEGGVAKAPPTAEPATNPTSCAASTIYSLRQLHAFDLSLIDVVICAALLPDGSGLDALAFIHGVRADLPVIITGETCDHSLAAEAIRAGALDYVVIAGEQLPALSLVIEKCLAHQRIKQENERLHRELSRFAGELADKNLQLQMMISQLQTMARVDELTSLCNRRWLNEMLDRSWAEATRHDRPLSCVMIDLDGLKLVNDSGGHQRGDALLRLTGKVIAANCRQVDIAARYGGDEFCILMPQTMMPEAVRVAERILREFNAALPGAFDDQPQVGMSIGVAEIDESRPVNAEQLVSHADEAMYAAKVSRPKCRVMLRGPEGARPAAPRGAGV